MTLSSCLGQVRSLRAYSLLLLAFALGADRGRAQADPAPQGSFRALHTLVGPQSDEAWYRLVPWETDIWEARRQAAAQGKPILIWAGSGGGPVGVC